MSQAEAKGWLRKRRQPGPLPTKIKDSSAIDSARGKPQTPEIYTFESAAVKQSICILALNMERAQHTRFCIKSAWFAVGIFRTGAVFFQFLWISPPSMLCLLAGSSIIERALSEVTKSSFIKAYISLFSFSSPAIAVIYFLSPSSASYQQTYSSTWE